MAISIVREVVGVFPDARSLQAAADELLLRGIDRSLLSLMPGRHIVARAIGRDYDRPEEIEDDPAVPRMAYVGTDSRVEGRSACAGAVAYVGACATAGAAAAFDASALTAVAATAAVGGVGAVVGAMIGTALDRPVARNLSDQAAHGGITLWVRIHDRASEDAICDILRLNGARDVHVHEIPHEPPSAEGGVSQHFAWIDKPLASWLTGRREA
ncbi:MAG TPA: hypothetical protein VKS60_13605 [Stellaceae bacterium]|nr:hypothetical protein [Stellaceae bacterium]